MESYTCEECKSDHYSSLWKIDEADNATPPCATPNRDLKTHHDDHEGVACVPDPPVDFQNDARAT